MEPSIMHLTLIQRFMDNRESILISEFRNNMRYIKFNRAVHWRIINELKCLGLVDVNCKSIIKITEKGKELVNKANDDGFLVGRTIEMKEIKKEKNKINSDWFI